MTTYANQTAYPKIFSNTYWGATEDGIDLPEQIIQNRNKFVEDNKIKTNITYSRQKRITQKKQIKNQLFFLEHMKGQTTDHIEFYDNGISVIGLSSNYNDSDEMAWVDAGFHKIEPLYTLDSTTFAIQLFY